MAPDGFNIPEDKTPLDDLAIPTALPKQLKDNEQAIPRYEYNELVYGHAPKLMLSKLI